MNYTLTWPWTDAEANLTIIFTTIAFLAWWFTGQSPQLLAQQSQKYGPEHGQTRTVFLKRIVGMLGFGLLPAIVLFLTQPVKWADYGVSAQLSPSVLYWTLGLSAILIPLVGRATRKPESLAQYPEIRQPNWSRTLFTWSALSWMGYLLAYELMFRGFLLFACARAFGPWPAIVINTAIYSLVHVPKSAREGIGAIPLGILLCIITFQTGTIWVAVIVHWVLALANEWFSLKYHPAINVKKPQA